jgi:hypothetical protein
LKSLKGKRTKPLTEVGSLIRRLRFSRLAPRSAVIGGGGKARPAGRRGAATDRVPAGDRRASEKVRIEVFCRRRSRRRWILNKFRADRRLAVPRKRRKRPGGRAEGAKDRAGPRGRSSERSAGGLAGLGSGVPTEFRKSSAKRLRSTRLVTRTKVYNVLASFRARNSESEAKAN